MTGPLSTLEIARLGKLAAMLASDNDGEALAALRAGAKLLDRHGLRWGDLLTCAVSKPSGPASAYPVTPTMDWQREAIACRSFSAAFTEWERAFLRGIVDARTLTPKQRHMLRVLHDKLEVHLAREAFAAGMAA